jgi:hypothetical protein
MGPEISRQFNVGNRLRWKQLMCSFRGERVAVVAGDVMDQLDKLTRHIGRIAFQWPISDSSEITARSETVLQKPANDWEMISPQKMPAESLRFRIDLRHHLAVGSQFVDESAASAAFPRSNSKLTIWFSGDARLDRRQRPRLAPAARRSPLAAMTRS